MAKPGTQKAQKSQEAQEWPRPVPVIARPQAGAKLPSAAELSGHHAQCQSPCAVSTAFSAHSAPGAPIPLPLNTALPPPLVWGIPPSRLRDMVYRLLEERSKKGAGRSMRALAWRVCAWVLPLYRNLEPITRKPLGGGSGDTSLQWRDGGAEGGSHLHCQAQSWTTADL